MEEKVRKYKLVQRVFDRVKEKVNGHDRWVKRAVYQMVQENLTWQEAKQARNTNRALSIVPMRVVKDD